MSDTVASVSGGMSSQEYNTELYFVNERLRSVIEGDRNPAALHALRTERKMLIFLRDSTLRGKIMFHPQGPPPVDVPQQVSAVHRRG